MSAHADCQAIVDLLIEHAEGELNPLERPRVEAHLSACPACAAEFALLREALGRARAVPVPEPTPDFWRGFESTLRRRLAIEPPPRRPWWQRLREQVAAGLRPAPALVTATALGLMLALGLVRMHRAPDRLAVDPIVLNEEIGLGQNLDVLEHFEILEDLDVLERLPVLLPPGFRS